MANVERGECPDLCATKPVSESNFSNGITEQKSAYYIVPLAVARLSGMSTSVSVSVLGRARRVACLLAADKQTR